MNPSRVLIFLANSVLFSSGSRSRTALILLALAVTPFVRGQVTYYLDEAVAKAKADHVAAITVPPPHISYEGQSSDLDEALAYYSVVVVRPVASVAVRTGSSIETWIKFEVVSTLHASPKCSPCDDGMGGSSPQGVGKLEANQIVVPYVGGTITVDGVRVTVPGVSSSTFLPQSKYVLFVSIQRDRAADPAAGHGAFSLAADGSLHPVWPRDRRPLTDEIVKLGNLYNLQNKIHARLTERL